MTTAGCNSSNPIATIKTNHGDIKVELFADKAPNMTKNFTELAKKGYYDGVIFHRIINDFMIQGGDPTGTGRGGESYQGGKMADEFAEGLTHERGVLSMANAGPNTNGSQFFIVTKKEGTSWLDGKHSIFGKVIEGMDVIDEIEAVETDSNDKPLEDVVMEKVTVE